MSILGQAKQSRYMVQCRNCPEKEQRVQDRDSILCFLCKKKEHKRLALLRANKV